MRRKGPRPIAAALGGLVRETAPDTLLSRVQGCWTDVVGPTIAEEAQPRSEREGSLTVVCRSAAWANELELLAPDLLEKLNRALGDPGDGPVKSLRAKVGRLP